MDFARIKQAQFLTFYIYNGILQNAFRRIRITPQPAKVRDNLVQRIPTHSDLKSHHLYEDEDSNWWIKD